MLGCALLFVWLRMRRAEGRGRARCVECIHTCVVRAHLRAGSEAALGLAGAEEAPYECPECEVVSCDADHEGGHVALGGEGGGGGGGAGMSEEVAAMMAECRRELEAEGHPAAQGDAAAAAAAAAACQHALGGALPAPAGSAAGEQEQVRRAVP